MRNRIILIAVVLAGVLACLGIRWSTAADEKPNAERPAAEHKVYVIYTDAASTVSGGGVVLTSLRREDFHGLTCLVGEGAEGWASLKGTTIRVPESKIVTIIEFENAAAWEKALPKDRHD